ncbi:MAG TPA: hypothetical protein QF446_01270 [Planctomycetota bacterium]|nr:hypothetical protein [Planctomycetota bacterium]
MDHPASKCTPLAVALAAVFLTAPLQAQKWGPWQVIGAFDHPEGAKNLERAHNPERSLGGMQFGRAGPRFGAVNRGTHGSSLDWMPLPGDSAQLDVGDIDFLRILTPPEKAPKWAETAAAYLYRTVEARADREVSVHVGSDDGMRLWLNGILLRDDPYDRELNLRDGAVELALKKGTNHLLVKVVNSGGGWKFRLSSFRDLPTQAINSAVEKGVNHLLNNQLLDGSWGGWRHLRPGSVAMRTYTLLRSGVHPGHPVIQRARAFILNHDNDATYVASAKILALAAMDQEGDRLRIKRLVDGLLDNRAENGLFEYSIGGYNSHLEEDLSNSLLAALALRAADQVGVKASKRGWEDLARGTLLCQGPSDGVPRTGLDVEPRGFRYRPDTWETSSMTTAGVSILEIYLQHAGRRGASRFTGPAQAGVRAGKEWLRRHFSWDSNVGQSNGAHHYFSVYGMERVGSLLGTTVVADQDWYGEGARKLIAWQRPDGTWPEDVPLGTELALLFLGRATAYSPKGEAVSDSRGWFSDSDTADFNLRASGDTPLTFWVDGISASKLSDLEWEGEAGDGLRVAKVQYYAQRDTPGSKIHLIASLDHDAQRASGLTRFAAQHRFPANGTWIIHSRMLCHRQPAEEGLVPEEVELLSASLEVTLEDVVTAEQLLYSVQAQENRVLGTGVKATATSQIEGEECAKAVDGLYATRWHCAVTDPDPKLTLTFPRALRGRRILLSHGWPRPRYSQFQRPLRVEVFVNGKLDRTIEMDPDAMSKTEIDLGRSRSIRQLELRITEAHYGRVGASPLGFSEVEILR